jgi:putative transposase
MTKASPTLLRFEKGELLNYNGQEYVLLKPIDLTKVLAKNMISKTTEVLEIRYLTPWVVKKDDKPQKQEIDLVDIPEEEWQFARERLKIIEPLLSKKVWGSEAVSKIAKDSGYGVATIYRWIRAYRNSGLLSDLLPEKGGWKSGTWRLDEQVEAIIKDRIENYYLTDQRRSIANTTEEIQRLCVNAGFPKPHWRTVKRRIDAIDERERYEKRYSVRAAKQIFDPNEGTVPNAG